MQNTGLDTEGLLVNQAVTEGHVGDFQEIICTTGELREVSWKRHLTEALKDV